VARCCKLPGSPHLPCPRQGGEPAAAAGPAGGGSALIGERRAPWTETELALLSKGSNKFPGGVVDRWGRIADFINVEVAKLQTESHGRTADEVIAKTRDLRKELEKRAARQREQRQQRAAAAATPAAPPKAAPPKPAPAKAGAQRFAAPAQGGGSAEPPPPPASAEWSAEQQRALEQALARFPASVEDRWDRIEEAVPGKTRAECVSRYKQIVAALKAKKAAAAAAKQ